MRVFSGGAIGADYEWSLAALEYGAKVEIMSFKHHIRSVPAGCIIRELSESQLSSANEVLMAICIRLNRTFPRPGSTLNLLRRNIHIVQHADAVYAIGKLMSDKRRVDGGTGYGCEYMKIFKPTPNLFLFETEQNEWITFRGETWVVEAPPHPSTFECIALIGSRDISERGKVEIKELFK